VKLYQVIGSAVARIPCWSDMPRFRRRCAQTAHISLHSFNFQRAKTQNKQHTRTSGVSAVVHPVILSGAFQPGPASVPPHRCVASSSVRRYLGKASGSRKKKKAGRHIFFAFPDFPTKSWG
jgi:hypothetical protein